MTRRWTLPAALLLLLCCTGECLALSFLVREYTLGEGRWEFGAREWEHGLSGERSTELLFGPLGSKFVPWSAPVALGVEAVLVLGVVGACVYFWLRMGRGREAG